MTTLPDWLVERAALDEVGSASKDRVARADSRELAARIAAIRDANAAELAAYPAAVAARQIAERVQLESKRRARRRWRWIGMLATATTAVAIVLVLFATPGGNSIVKRPPIPPAEDTRVKGVAHLLVFRQAGDNAERLDEDALVRAGDVLQLRYSAGGHGYGVIASIDGAGVVTLHYPAAEDATTALAPKTTALPTAYVLDNAPRFERFFFITSAQPIDTEHVLATLRTFAARTDSATAALELPATLQQWSLRLRKPAP